MSTQPHQPPAEPIRLPFVAKCPACKGLVWTGWPRDEATEKDFQRKADERAATGLIIERGPLDALTVCRCTDAGRLKTLSAELEAERAKYTEAVYAMTKHQNERDALLAELEQAIESKAHTQQYYAERFEPLKEWARNLPPDLRNQFFSLIANASTSVHDGPPELTVQLNLMRHRAEKAEAEFEQARAQLAEAEAKLTTILEDQKYKGGVQYWIRKHDEIMLLATRIAAESVTATADRDAQAALAGELRRALEQILNLSSNDCVISFGEAIKLTVAALALSPSAALAGRLEAAFREGWECHGVSTGGSPYFAHDWQNSETRKSL